MSFIDKVVIVTGSSSGIGAATAILFAKEGGNVVMVGRNETKLSKVQQQCDQVGGKKVLVVKADVSVEEDAIRIIKETVTKFGKLDVLVNNAGIGNNSEFEKDDSMKVFDLVMNTNFRSIVNLTNLAIQYLVKTKGNIVNVSSIATTLVFKDRWAYCASKAALDPFSRCTAMELALKGVRVNVISPRPVRTVFMESVGMKESDWDVFSKITALNKCGEPKRWLTSLLSWPGPKLAVSRAQCMYLTMVLS